MSLTETYLRFSYLFHSASTSFPPPPPLHSPSVLPPSPVRSRSPNYPTVAKSISSPLLVKRRLPTSFYGFRETIISFSSFLSKKRRSATDNISRYLSSSKEENKFRNFTRDEIRIGRNGGSFIACTIVQLSGIRD